MLIFRASQGYFVRAFSKVRDAAVKFVNLKLKFLKFTSDFWLGTICARKRLADQTTLARPNPHIQNGKIAVKPNLA